MPRLYGSAFEDEHPGTLTLRHESSDRVDVFYTPSQERVQLSGIGENDTETYRLRLLQIDGRKKSLTVFPIRTTGRQDVFMKPKYPQVERITVEDQRNLDIDFERSPLRTQEDVMMLLEQLPSCFVKDFDWGLGLRQPYRFIVDAVENLSDCTEILISDQCETGVDRAKRLFSISLSDFNDIRKTINKIATQGQIEAQTVNYDNTWSFFADKLGLIRALDVHKPAAAVARRSILNVSRSPAQEARDTALTIVNRSAETIAKDQPEQLATLKENIELATLQALIDRFESMTKSKALENEWQRFLDDNPFLLSLAFGYPVIKVHGQASVGGRKLSGRGDKVADFLVKNSMTNNCAIVELKRPNTKLLNRKAAQNGVYTPSSELVGAINQALDQKYQFDRQITQIKENSGIHDIKSYSVHCCLLIGSMPKDEDRQKSFELFRGNSKDVEIVTFDELLQKLRQFRDFLKSSEVNPSPPIQSQ